MRRTRSVPAFLGSTLVGLDDWDMMDLMPMNEKEEAVQMLLAKAFENGKGRVEAERIRLRNAYHELVKLVSPMPRGQTD